MKKLVVFNHERFGNPKMVFWLNLVAVVANIYATISVSPFHLILITINGTLAITALKVIEVEENT